MGMLLYPLGILVTSMLGLEQAGKILGDMASVYFVSVAVAAYFGANAYVDKKNKIFKSSTTTTTCKSRD